MKNIFKYISQIILLLLIFTFSCNYFDDLLSFEYPNFNPRYSPDGSSLIFDIRYQGNSKIFLYNLNTSEVKIFNDKENMLEIVGVPSFSKDGKYITFVKGFNDPLIFEIFFMKSNGTEIKQLTKNNQISSIPIFSNNGEKIFFCRKPEIKWTYYWYSLDINTLEQRKVSSEEFIHAINPAVTPDGRYIIFADTDLSKVNESGEQYKKLSGDDYEAEKIVKLDIYTGKIKYLMFGNQIRPVVSKDGYILFSGYQNKKRIFYGKEYPAFEEGIYKMDIDGNNLQLILKGDQISNLLKNTGKGIYKDDHFASRTLRLSPDEKYIFFESGNNKFYEVSLDGKEKREIIFNKKRIKEFFKKNN